MGRDETLTILAVLIGFLVGVITGVLVGGSKNRKLTEHICGLIRAGEGAYKLLRHYANGVQVDRIHHVNISEALRSEVYRAKLLVCEAEPVNKCNGCDIALPDSDKSYCHYCTRFKEEDDD
jgi:uncharacterized membrane protein YebE (DUF533 family)